MLVPLTLSAQDNVIPETEASEDVPEAESDSLTPPGLVIIRHGDGNDYVSNEIRMPIYNPQRYDAKIRVIVPGNPPYMPGANGENFVNPLFDGHDDAAMALDRFEPDQFELDRFQPDRLPVPFSDSLRSPSPDSYPAPAPGNSEE